MLVSTYTLCREDGSYPDILAGQQSLRILKRAMQGAGMLMLNSIVLCAEYDLAEGATI